MSNFILGTAVMLVAALGATATSPHPVSLVWCGLGFAAYYLSDTP